MRLPLLATLLLLLLGCPATREAPTPSPKPVPDTELIPEMCRHIGPVSEGGLGCDEGNPTYNSDLPGPPGVPNQSCVDFYTELQDRGYFVNPRCILLVTSCDQIEPARQKLCP